MRRLLIVIGMYVAGYGLAAPQTAAQEFGVYLSCKGQLKSSGKSRAAELELALRRNSQLAMISASNVLPAGQRLRLEITPRFYTMTFVVPTYGGVWYDWFHGEWVAWSPFLRNLHVIRISVDRQSTKLEGELRDGVGASLGRLDMRCEPRDNETVEEPKF